VGFFNKTTTSVIAEDPLAPEAIFETKYANSSNYEIEFKNGSELIRTIVLTF
jgi:hypothetical protein